MAFIEQKFEVNEKATDRLFNGFKELFNQPRWLITLLLSVIIVGAVYFITNYYKDKKDFLELQEQVNEINIKAQKQINTQDYNQALLYIITEIQLFRSSEEQWYQEEIHEIDILIHILSKYHTTDNADIQDLHALKTRLELNQKIYKQNCDYQLDCLNKILQSCDSINK